MKPSRLLLAVTTLTLALLFTLAVPTPIAGTPTAPPAPVDARKLITSVDAATGTIGIENKRDKTTRTYKIDDFTSVKVNNSRGKIADIKVGMQVRDSIERDSQTLDSISVDMADAAPEAPKKK
jgi:hypothetical protein